VDTVVHVPSDSLYLKFVVAPVTGGVFRRLRSHETLRNTSVAALRDRTPVDALIVIDHFLNAQSQGANDCNLQLGGAAQFARGLHRMQINAPECLPLDTTLMVTGPLDCPDGRYGGTRPGSTPCILTLTPMPYIRFDWPLKIGTTWIYAYYLSRKLNPFERYSQRGVHTWVLTDSVTVADTTLVTGWKTVYRCKVALQDTIWDKQTLPPRYSQEESFFDIAVCGSSIRVDMEGKYVISLGGSTTHPGVVQFDRGTCEEGKGLVSYYVNSVTNTQGAVEQFDLLEMRIP
jgi:hypothetical protein